MSSQWPLVAARLYALLPTLPHWADVEVWDGAAFDVSKATFATVGHATDGVQTAAGTFTKTQASDGYRVIEQGSVACQITCTDDELDQAALRTLIFGLFDDIEAAIRTDRTLGVLSDEGTTDLTVDITSMQTIPGAATTVAFTVDYYTVT